MLPDGYPDPAIPPGDREHAIRKVLQRKAVRSSLRSSLDPEEVAVGILDRQLLEPGKSDLAAQTLGSLRTPGGPQARASVDQRLREAVQERKTE